MEQYYSSERNVQILVSLLKQHGIKRVVVSPGSTNVCFVGSIQQNPYFEMYSCVDERSAAYMAVGLAAETKEPVALSCTGATASRNYFSAFPEGYYSNLPILPNTSTQDENRIGNLIPQVLDRSQQPNDIVKLSQHLQNVKDKEDEWDVTLKANRAILELNHHGLGPVHINLSTTYSKDFSVKTLPTAQVIHRYDSSSESYPDVKEGKIAIYCGTHLKWSSKEVEATDRFCEAYNAVVFCDPASNYTGKYKVNFSLVGSQQYMSENRNPDLLIHIGNMSDMCSEVGNPKEVWRVSEDGKLADRYRTLTNVFEMKEEDFFNLYSEKQAPREMTYFESCHKEETSLIQRMPDLPFSHIWIASQIAPKLPQDSVLHLGILAPLRSWSYFDIDKTIEVECNQGGFGIDGNMSTMIGASLAQPSKIHFAVVGDLSFFYDLNSLGNRHVGRNVRILLINNSLGEEFLLFKQINSTLVNDVQKYIAAEGHFGHKSPDLVRHYASDLGYEYMSAWSKEEFVKCYERFTTPELTEKPMIFECFTDPDKENEALKRMWEIKKAPTSIKHEAKQAVKNVIGKENTKKIKEIMRIIKK
jgi:2-succinyl-5-enolpyruvyl-6-hydroxy-3-cyclohexene-1-carboxylate synthase